MADRHHARRNCAPCSPTAAAQPVRRHGPRQPRASPTTSGPASACAAPQRSRVPEPWARAASRTPPSTGCTDLEGALGYAEELGYGVAVTWSQDRLDGLDLLLAQGRPPAYGPGSAYGAAAATNHPRICHHGPALARALKDHLSGSGPHYMVPGVFVGPRRTAAHPQRQGRQAGPAGAGRGRRDTRSGYVAPRTATERTLCRLVAGRPRPRPSAGLQDNFFDLGGHSLLATRLTLRVKQETGGSYRSSRSSPARPLGELAAALDSLRTAARPAECPADLRSPGPATI